MALGEFSLFSFPFLTKSCIELLTGPGILRESLHLCCDQPSLHVPPASVVTATPELLGGAHKKYGLAWHTPNDRALLRLYRRLLLWRGCSGITTTAVPSA
jgi:hypothetical protein